MPGHLILNHPQIKLVFINVMWNVYGWIVGWQYRWFTVDPQTGTLSYYICENNGESTSPPNIVGNSPRWQEHLAGAVVCPSDEDSRTFTIGTANGDTLKLRANDARARQEWVDALRNIAECHTQVNGKCHF